MPYLIDTDKQKLLDHMWPEHPGELNFLVTSLALRYWSKSPRNYRAINDVIGALEAAKLEFYRRLAVPYENKKIKLNGDVYPDEF